MKVIVQEAMSFRVAQYDNVSNIAYNKDTKIVTITYGSAQTVTYDLNNPYYISILW